jgi:hypothetical protein
MNDAENFLARWSRRKREVAAEPDAAESKERQPSTEGAEASAQAEAARSQPSAAAADAPAVPTIDLSTLPAIDSITAETDIRGFFAPGVPSDLKLAALRRAWVADPKIRDFIEVADYDFDFHTPGAIPGFGPLEMTDELRREVARMLGQVDFASLEPAQAGSADAAHQPQSPEAITEMSPQASATPSSTAPPQAVPQIETDAQRADEQSRLASLQSDDSYAAPQQSHSAAEDLSAPARRRRGGALPQ